MLSNAGKDAEYLDLWYIADEMRTLQGKHIKMCNDLVSCLERSFSCPVLKYCYKQILTGAVAKSNSGHVLGGD